MVGNPDIRQWEDKFSDLPGARREAQRVHELFSAGGYESRDYIDENAAAILESLHRDAWRILHLVGHGAHEFVLKEPSEQTCKACGQPPRERERLVSGMVIGKETFLTPGDVEQTRWVPELVFINCCHLGATGARGPESSELPEFNRLAAYLAMQFIRMGVRAVVAAGWAVDDAAALAFADAFYRRMLDGETFGEGVRAAREEVWMRFPGVNTWGAYQCYGDPAYSLQRNGPQRQRERLSFHAPDELVVELDNLTEWLRVGAGSAGRDDATAARINGLLGRIPETERTRWLARADVAAALGFAWGEARFWEAAIDCLSTALSAAKGNCPLRALEQPANFRAPHAAELWQSRRARGVVETADEVLARTELMERRDLSPPAAGAVAAPAGRGPAAASIRARAAGESWPRRARCR